MIAAALVWFVVAGLLALVYSRLSWHPLDPIAVFCYLFVFFYLFRDTVVTFGVDRPYPDALFVPGQTAHLLLHAGAALGLFLVAFLGTYVLHEPYADSLVRFAPVTWSVPSIRRQARLAFALTATATALSIVLVYHYGGVGEMVRASKRTNSLAGSYELRIFPAIGAVVAASLALSLWQRRREDAGFGRVLGAAAACAALVDAGFVLLWGSRQAAAVVLLILLAGRWLLGHDAGAGEREDAAGRFRPGVLRLAAVGAVLVLAITGLRLARDTIVVGHVASTIQGQSTVRKVSVATNSTYFDALLLATRDWPSSFPYRGGRDFVVGAEAIVPRVLWPSKPEDVRPGSWFRQLYEPQHRNGWPLGAVGDWYLNFGLLGVLAGGALSGVVFSGLTAAWRRAPWSPFTISSLFCVLVFVVPTGVEALTPLRWAQWVLPLLLCARYLDVPGERRTAETHGHAAPAGIPAQL
jgi:hypothetical protein